MTSSRSGTEFKLNCVVFLIGDWRIIVLTPLWILIGYRSGDAIACQVWVHTLLVAKASRLQLLHLYNHLYLTLNFPEDGFQLTVKIPPAVLTPQNVCDPLLSENSSVAPPWRDSSLCSFSSVISSRTGETLRVDCNESLIGGWRNMTFIPLLVCSLSQQRDEFWTFPENSLYLYIQLINENYAQIQLT